MTYRHRCPYTLRDFNLEKMSHLITVIQEAEDQSKIVLDQADKNAESVIQDSQASAEKSADDQYQKAVQKAQDVLAGAKGDTSKVYNDVLSSYTSELKNIESNFNSKKSGVIDMCEKFILKKITA